MMQQRNGAESTQSWYLAFAHVPAHERVLDRLTELLIAADDVRDILLAEDAAQLRWLEPHVSGVFDEVNRMMKKLSD